MELTGRSEFFQVGSEEQEGRREGNKEREEELVWRRKGGRGNRKVRGGRKENKAG